jgi:RimJ/RimL family protein N-acetyltransferase
MLKPLPDNFSFNRYGITARLVTERDTDYILSLRTNKSLTRFIHQTANDREKHLEWFHRYKQRESEARDYYFIYEKNGVPVGLNRIYNIFEYYGTIGSWLCNPDNPMEVSMATYFMMLDILFEVLDLDLTIFDVRKANKHVWKLHEQLGAKEVGESDIDYYFVMAKPDYLVRRDKFITLLNLK